MSLIGDIEHGFLAVINGVEQVGKDVESLVNHAIGDLESLGIGVFGDMAAFVHWLLQMGEDPVAVISAMAGRAASVGGDVGPVLSEVASGVLSQGLQGFATKTLTQAVSPIITTLNEQTTRGSQVATLHQTTVSTMQSRLTALTTGSTSSGQPWLGESPDAMMGTFGDLSQFLGQLGDQIQHDGQQAILNRTFIQVLEGIGVLAIGMAIFDLLLLVVEGVVAVIGLVTGPGDVLIVGGEALLDAGLIAAEMDILLALVGADAAAWLVGTLLIYVISHPISLPTHTTFPITKPVAPNTVFATKLQTANGPIRARKLSNGEVKKLRDDDGTPFEKVKQKLGYPANADIYVDQNGDYWIVMPGSDYAEPFP